MPHNLVMLKILQWIPTEFRIKRKTCQLVHSYPRGLLGGWISLSKPDFSNHRGFAQAPSFAHPFSFSTQLSLSLSFCVSLNNTSPGKMSLTFHLKSKFCIIIFHCILQFSFMRHSSPFAIVVMKLYSRNYICEIISFTPISPMQI